MKQKSNKLVGKTRRSKLWTRDIKNREISIINVRLYFCKEKTKAMMNYLNTSEPATYNK